MACTSPRRVVFAAITVVVVACALLARPARAQVFEVIMRTSLGYSMCVEVPANNQASGQALQQARCAIPQGQPDALTSANSVSVTSQTFTIEQVGPYMQVRTSAGLCLTAGDLDHLPSPGCNVILRPCVPGSLAQLFNHSPTGMQPQSDPRLCVEVGSSSIEPGAKLQLGSCNAGLAQRLPFAPAAARTKGTIRRTVGGTSAGMIPNIGGFGSLCLDIPNNNQVCGQAVQQWQCTGTLSQAFTRVLVSDPTDGSGPWFQVLSSGGLCLTAGDTLNPVPVNDQRVLIRTCSDGALTQQFRYRNGALQPRNAPAMCLDVAGDSRFNGARVQIRFCSGMPSQALSMILS